MSKIVFDFHAVFAIFEYDIAYSGLSWEYEVSLLRWGRHVLIDAKSLGYDITIFCEDEDQFNWMTEYVGIFDFPTDPKVIQSTDIPNCQAFVTANQERANAFKKLYPNRVVIMQHSDKEGIEGYALGYNDMIIALKLMQRHGHV